MFQNDNIYNEPYDNPYQNFYQQPPQARTDTTSTPVESQNPSIYWQDAPLPPIYPPQSLAQMPSSKPDKRGRGGRAGGIIALALALLVVFGVGLFAGWQFVRSSNSVGTTPTTSAASSNVTTSTVSSNTASSDNALTIQGQQETAIAKIEPAVVELDVTTDQGQQIGSGVIIDTNGNIVTNAHVVSGAQTIKAVLNDGKTETARLIGTVAANDLAVVRIQPFANMTIATFGDSSQLKVGQEVLAVGNPLGITETATSGIVSALNRSVSESASVSIDRAIQTDAPINPGNSGGALVNLNGELVGIPTLGAVDTESNTPANGVGFAIPSNVVKTAVASILSGK